MVNWDNIHSVLLDMDGTLLDLNFDNHFWQEHLPRHYAALHGADPDTTRVTLAERFKAAEGRLEWYCLDYWGRELGVDLIALKREINHLIAIRPHALEFLQALRAAGKQVLLVTNAHHGSLSLKMERSRLQHYFDVMVCSHDLGFPKEDVRFWDVFYRTYAVKPGSALLIDDSLPVLQAARRAGLGHLLAVSKPDSRRPARTVEEFPMVGSFADIMPP